MRAPGGMRRSCPSPIWPQHPSSTKFQPWSGWLSEKILRCGPPWMKTRKRSKCNVMLWYEFLMLCRVRFRYVMLCCVLFSCHVILNVSCRIYTKALLTTQPPTYFSRHLWFPNFATTFWSDHESEVISAFQERFESPMEASYTDLWFLSFWPFDGGFFLKSKSDVKTHPQGN